MAHQFTHIGAHTFCAMGSVVNKDVPPYVTVSGHPARPYGINSEGLRRRGFSDERIMSIKRGYKLIYKQQLTLEDAIVALRGMVPACSDISHYVDFLDNTERGIVR